MVLRIHIHNPELSGTPHSVVSCFLFLLPLSCSQSQTPLSTFPFWDLIYPLVVNLQCQQDKIFSHHGNIGFCLWGYFQEGLTEQRKIYPKLVEGTKPWSGVPDSIKMEKVSRTPTLISPYILTADVMCLPSSCSRHQAFPTMGYCCGKLWAKTCNPWSCFCQEFYHANENSKQSIPWWLILVTFVLLWSYHNQGNL